LVLPTGLLGPSYWSTWSFLLVYLVLPTGLLGPSYWSTCEWFPFVYFLYGTDFRHSVHVTKPTQSLSFNILYYYLPVFYFINSSNSFFVLILQIPLPSSVGPNIFLIWKLLYFEIFE